MRKPSYKTKFRSEFCALKNAIDRCTRTTHPQYDDYGGRGLTVDPEFMCPYTGFVTFIADVGAKPDPSLTLERKNNSLGYIKGNLVWVSRTENQRNRRAHSTVCKDLGWGIGELYTDKTGSGHGRKYSPLIPCKGRTQTLIEWARELNMVPATIRQRIKRGLSPEQALDPNTSRKPR
jgi:hypothetical protein